MVSVSANRRLMCVQIVLGSVQVAEWPPFGKELLTRLTVFLFVLCMCVTLVIFQFGFDDRILVLIVQIQGRSLLVP